MRTGTNKAPSAAKRNIENNYFVVTFIRVVNMYMCMCAFVSVCGI